jgi:hypothetical protein
MKNGKSLKPVQLTAIQLLAIGTPASHVAERLEVSAMTIYRWQRLPEFEAKLHAVTSSGLEEIAKKMNATALTAVETLHEVLCDLSQPVPTRMKAALGVLGVMGSVNGALERGLQHRAADFDLKQRWSSLGHTYEATGQTCHDAGVTV